MVRGGRRLPDKFRSERMIGRYWRGLRRWLHDKLGNHNETAFVAKYGRVCSKCHLPVRWEPATEAYVLKQPFERHPPVGRSQ